MDPNVVVLDISSDEEVGWDGFDGKGISDGDDHNWIAELLDEVNKNDCDYDDGGNDSDEVVVVSEVLPPRKHRKKLTSKSSSLIDLDDDCVVLDHDPDKPLEVRNDNPIDRDEDKDDDPDDLVVVSEKGQVACRDYPHPRHLCIKFPFSSTPNETHCEQCYCYVCDSLAPCLYWGNGSATLDHCHATEKDKFWKLERQNSKNGPQPVSNGLPPPPMNLIPPPSVLVQTPSMAHLSSNFGVPNIINQNRSPFLLPMSKYQIRTSSCTNPRDRGQHNYNLGTPFHRPVFKRTVSAGFASSANRYSYSSYRENLVNASGSVPPPNIAFEEPFEFSNQQKSNTLFDFSTNFQPEVNSDSFVQTPVQIQPHSISFSSLPNYSNPPEPSQQGNQGQRSTIDPKFFNDISWPQSQTDHQTILESTVPISGELVSDPDDNWIYENQPCEPESMDNYLSYGLCDLSEPTIIDTENKRRYRS